MSIEITPKARREILVAALRDRSMWPSGFTWHFPNCARCALGLAHALLGLGHEPTMRAVPQLLGMAQADAHRIFVATDEGEEYPGPRDMVTPEMIADRLEAYNLAR